MIWFTLTCLCYHYFFLISLKKWNEYDFLYGFDAINLLFVEEYYNVNLYACITIKEGKKSKRQAIGFKGYFLWRDVPQWNYTNAHAYIPFEQETQAIESKGYILCWGMLRNNLKIHEWMPFKEEYIYNRHEFQIKWANLWGRGCNMIM